MITSPNWPRKFTKFLKCDFEIIVEGTRRIQLIFKEFLLVGNGTCMGNNYVEVCRIYRGKGLRLREGRRLVGGRGEGWREEGEKAGGREGRG